MFLGKTLTVDKTWIHHYNQFYHRTLFAISCKLQFL